MITLDNVALFKKTISEAKVDELLCFSQGGTTNVISFIMKTDLQKLINLLCALDTNDFGETFFNHKRETGVIGVTVLAGSICKLNLYLSEEYELYTQIQHFVSDFNKTKILKDKEVDNAKAKDI